MSSSSNSLAIKSGFWYIVGNFLTKSMGLITTPIFTRLMTKNDIGDFSNLLSWVEILMVITTLDLFSSVSVARFDFKDRIDEYISSNLLLGTIITAICYIVCLVFNTTFSKLTGISWMEIHIIFLYLLFYPSIQMLLIKARIEYKYKTTLFLSLASTVISTLLSLSFVLVFDNKLSGRIYGYFLPLIILNIIIYLVLMSRGKSVNIKYWKYALLISGPYAWHVLSGNILGSSDKIMIKYFIGSEATAYYTIAYYCSMLIRFFGLQLIMLGLLGHMNR